jgi:hypothetical protein
MQNSIKTILLFTLFIAFFIVLKSDRPKEGVILCDLVIEKIDYYSPKQEFVIRIKNDSKNASPMASTLFGKALYKNKNVCTQQPIIAVPRLQANEYCTVYWSLPKCAPQAGLDIRDFEFRVDPIDTIRETNETNNIKKFSF